VGWKASNIPDLSGRVAVVTGGNRGLGLATSRQLAAHGATVVIGARNMSRAEAACGAIREETPNAHVEVRPLDLASLASVRSFAEGVLADHPRVDLLFCNAGVMACPEGLTADGLETQIGTNFFGHFALTMRLVPALIAAADASPAGARVVCTTSMARVQAKSFDPENIQLRGPYNPWAAYANSKRAVLEFAIELERRLGERGVHGFGADPGLSRTDLQTTAAASMDSSQHRFWVRMMFLAQSAEKGALDQLRAGTDPRAPGGVLYAPRWISFGSPVVRRLTGPITSAAEHRALWELAERETGITLESVLPAR
jgi:NAD(P)-dependent dehydrogenase (short-subunit alcohol dehydrogenase family)